MKIKIAYTEEEKEQADQLAAIYLERIQMSSSATITKSDRHKPFFHIYIADKKKRLDKKTKV